MRLGIDNDDFIPTIVAMISDLEFDPKRFPKKSGKLADARAYSLRYRGDAWRAVFTVADEERIVRILSFAPHDDAYEQAERRI